MKRRHARDRLHVNNASNHMCKERHVMFTQWDKQIYNGGKPLSRRSKSLQLQSLKSSVFNKIHHRHDISGSPPAWKNRLILVQVRLQQIAGGRFPREFRFKWVKLIWPYRSFLECPKFWCKEAMKFQHFLNLKQPPWRFFVTLKTGIQLCNNWP